MEAILKRLHQRAAALSGTADTAGLFAGSSAGAGIDTGTKNRSAKVTTDDGNETNNRCAERASVENNDAETFMEDETNDSCAGGASEENDDAETFVEDETNNSCAGRADVENNDAETFMEDETCATEGETKKMDSVSSNCMDSKTESQGAVVTDSEKPKQNKDGGFECELCHKTFKWPNQLQVHLDKKHPEAPKKCESCGKKFSWNCQLPSHTCQAEVRAVAHYECPVCKKRFPRSGALKVHQEEHPELRTYTCIECHKAYATRAPLIAHLREVHGEDSPEYTKYLEELKSKRRKTRDLRSYQRRLACKVCGKVYKQAYELAGHMNTHTGDKPHRCHLCGKSFALKNTLTGHHRYVHLNERPSSCSVCGKAFKKSDALKTHMRIHTGERPFACELCNKAFTQKASLKKHMVIHTKEKRCKCDICGVAYLWKSSLQQHITKCHSERQPQSEADEQSAVMLSS